MFWKGILLSALLRSLYYVGVIFFFKCLGDLISKAIQVWSFLHGKLFNNRFDFLITGYHQLIVASLKVIFLLFWIFSGLTSWFLTTMYLYVILLMCIFLEIYGSFWISGLMFFIGLWNFLAISSALSSLLSRDPNYRCWDLLIMSHIW